MFTPGLVHKVKGGPWNGIDLIGIHSDIILTEKNGVVASEQVDQGPKKTINNR
jgi:hypothetical protein